MLRRSFLRLASAAVLGVMAAKVPMFAEELPVSDFKAGVKPIVTSMWAYPVKYALPMQPVSAEMAEYVALNLKRFEQLTSTITVESVPSNIDSTWMVTSRPAPGTQRQ